MEIALKLAAADKDLSSARGPEMYLAMWVRLFGATKTGQLNVKVVR